MRLLTANIASTSIKTQISSIRYVHRQVVFFVHNVRQTFFRQDDIILPDL